MAPAKAEIKVALIGHVSVGKTTVLNALFRDKFGEVSMKRTTAAVNYFRIVSKRPTEDKAEAGSTEEKSKQWADVASYDTKSAGCILKEITEDNKELRNASGIKEKFFDIELDDPLCDMRENTNLVVVDIPGINEAGVGSKYRDFVEKKWDKFDVAVLVMDGKQGVNTEEQLKLLQFVKSNQEAKRQIPLIILLNKVDDPDDEIQAVLVDESRQEVEKQFGCRIEEPLTTHNEPRKEAPIPVLIPTSAMHAYFYRTASQMTFDQFKSIDQELIEKMGREEIGRFKWKELSEDKRYQAVYDAVSGEGQYNERLEATNFDKLLSALKEIIGDEQTQLITLREQVLVTLSNLPKKQGLTDEFKSAYEKSKTVGMPAEPLRDMYWSMYEELEKRVIGAFVGPAARHVLSEPMIEMAIFYELACRASWEDDQKKALDRMRFLVRHLLVFIFKNVKECKEKMKTGTVVPKSPPLEWSDLSPLDWHSICSSFLLLGYSKSFCSTFGREKMLLEILRDSLMVLVLYSL
jgi:small GTP-binding protein